MYLQFLFYVAMVLKLSKSCLKGNKGDGTKGDSGAKKSESPTDKLLSPHSVDSSSGAGGSVEMQ